MPMMTWIYAIASISWAARILLANDFQLPLIHQHSFLNWATMVVNFLLLVIRQVNYLIIRYDITSNENVQIKNLLSERESLISSLMKANKTAATGALSAAIAHELNQPLGASNLNIQFLKLRLRQGDLNSETYEEVLSALDSDNKRAAQIVKSLRSIFSENNSQPEKINLNDAILRVIDIVGPELNAKNIYLELNVRGDFPVKINSNEIEQVILNLINNSIQSLMHTSVSQAQIAIEMYKTGDFVCLSIADNGEGIRGEFKPNLFQLLTTTKKTGMGLGLWLCRHIVTECGGNIWHEDVSGGGAKFIIQLPLCI
jgi:C4-dicarboxylate-specific signal transduction histidine kinase